MRLNCKRKNTKSGLSNIFSVAVSYIHSARQSSITNSLLFALHRCIEGLVPALHVLAAKAGDEVTSHVQLNPLFLFDTNFSFFPFTPSSLFQLPQTVLKWHLRRLQSTQMESFVLRPRVFARVVNPCLLSVLVPATQKRLLRQHSCISSHAVAAIWLDRDRDCVVRARARVCVVASLRSTPLHSTLLSPADASESPCPLMPDEP